MNFAYIFNCKDPALITRLIATRRNRKKEKKEMKRKEKKEKEKKKDEEKEEKKTEILLRESFLP